MIKNKYKSNINREITFPIKIGNHTITASPGDTVGSALYFYNIKQAKKIKYSGKRFFIFSKINNPPFSLNSNYEVELGFDIMLDQEAYPELNVDLNYLEKNISFKLLNELPIINSHFKRNNKKLKQNIITDEEILSSHILIVGGGIQGLLAASILVKAGIKVVLLERDFILGGYFGFSGKNLKSWTNKIIADLVNYENCKILKNTNLIFSNNENNFFALKKTYYKDQNNSLTQSYKLLRINAKHTIIATGLKERSLPNLKTNKSNIFLASEVCQLINRFGLSIPNGIVLYTNNNFGWDTALNLLSLGVEIRAIIDTRTNCDFSAACPVFRGSKIIKTYGNSNLKSLKISDSQGKIYKIKTTFLIVSGGFDLNLGPISDIIESVKWSPKNLTFIPNKYSSKVDILGNCNDIYCINSILNNTLEIVFKILEKNFLKKIDYTFPTFAKQNLNAELVTYCNSYQNSGLTFFNKIIKKVHYSFFLRSLFKNKKNNKMTSLKLNALKLFSNDKLIKRDIRKNVFTEDQTNFLKILVSNHENSFNNLNNYMFKTPYRLLNCNEFYNEIGCESKVYNGWLIPKFFFQNKLESKEINCINHELALISNVGITDQSDLAKISIVGKDVLTFLQNFLDLSDFNFREKSFFSFVFSKDDKFFDSLLVLKISSEYVLILLSAFSENEFYEYLLSKLSDSQEELKCNIYLESDNFQIFSLVGSLASDILRNKFNMNISQFLKKSENNIYNFNYFGQDLLIFFQNQKTDIFSIMINSINAEKFLRDIYSDIKAMKGGFIGREAFIQIKMDIGFILGNKLKKTEISKSIPINSFEIQNKDNLRKNDFKIFSNYFFYSKIVCLFPIGFTKNIVKGSEVYDYKKGKKLSLLGKVIISFYYPKMQNMLAFMILFKQNIKIDFVIVQNVNKKYQTLCEAKKYNDFF